MKDSTSYISSKSNIHSSVKIGPFCYIGDNVKIDEGCELKSHVSILGNTNIGKNNIFYPFSSIGSEPHDLKFKNEKSYLFIGNNNTFRENVTVNPGTKGGGLKTVIKNNCLFMVGSHIAHDCQIESNVILANNATLGGHVEVGDYAFIAGLAAVHQFVRIGPHSMVGGMSGVEGDVIPYGTVTGNRANLSGLNLVGLKRRGFKREDINGLRQAYRMLFAPEGTLQERIEDVARLYSENSLVLDIVNFVQSDSSRRICQPRTEGLE